MSQTDKRPHRHDDVRKWLRETAPVQTALHADELLLVNLVERWFRELTEKRIRREVFHSVPELTNAIYQYRDSHNEHPKPFVWAARVEDIVRRVSKCKAILQTVRLGAFLQVLLLWRLVLPEECHHNRSRERTSNP